MKENYTDITVVLDRSGSMQAIAPETIGGFNSFVVSQKEVDGTATLTLVQFDNEYEVVHNAIDIQDVPLLNDETFIPRGFTALLDAIGKSINSTGQRLANMKECDRPAKVVFVIITDGHENSSKEFSKSLINDLIKSQTEIYNWDFVFLAANQDAISTGTQLGIKAGMSMSYGYTGQGVHDAFASVATNMTSLRGGDISKKSTFFEDQDRDKQIV